MSDETIDEQTDSLSSDPGTAGFLSKSQQLLAHNYTRYLLGGLFFLLVPTFTGPFLATEVVMFAIFALGYMLLLGYAGEISFGHSAYIATGAYVTIISMHQFIPNFYLSAAIGVLAATVVGAVYGALCLRRRGIYFAMITLALGQMTYYIYFQWKSVTGGLDGISIPITASARIGPFNPLSQTPHLYIAGVALFILLFLFVRRILRSPYGRTVIAIRENEERMRNLGYHSERYLWSTFVLSAAVSGIAGVMYAALFAFVSPQIAYWTMSGEVVMMVLLGGIGTLGGTIIGSFLLAYLADVLSVITDDWRLFFGFFVIILVLFAPQGIYGLYQDVVEGRLTRQDIAEFVKQIR